MFLCFAPPTSFIVLKYFCLGQHAFELCSSLATATTVKLTWTFWIAQCVLIFATLTKSWKKSDYSALHHWIHRYRDYLRAPAEIQQSVGDTLADRPKNDGNNALSCRSENGKENSEKSRVSAHGTENTSLGQGGHCHARSIFKGIIY